MAEYLYKYRSVTRNNAEWISRIFTHLELYFSPVTQFNDPFDCKFSYNFDASDAEKKRYLNARLIERFPNADRNFRRAWIKTKGAALLGRPEEFANTMEMQNNALLAEIGVCSLTRIPNDILMWSHYADCHRGFCIQFLDDDSDPFIGRAQEVIYSKDYPVLNPILDEPTTKAEKAFLTKAAHWSYEQEWRILDYELGPGARHFPSRLLRGVIFGCRMGQQHRDMVRHWCDGRNVSFFEAQEASRKYALDIVPLT